MPTSYPWAAPAAALLLGYALGAIPFGLLLTWIGGAGDLRQIGSGNIGATNVLRTGRKGLAAATLMLDIAKGWGAVWLAEYWFPGHGVVAAAGAFLGHCFPIWLRFRGGKGVATLMGIVLALSPVTGLIYAFVWVALLGVVRISSVAGMTAAIATPVTVAILGQFQFVLLLLALALLCLWQHRGNIDRLLAGREPRIGDDPKIGDKGG